MKSFFVLIVICIIVLAPACLKLNPVVGSDSDIEIIGLSFTVEKTYNSGSYLYVDGTVRYSGSTKISSPWFIEGQFYTDSTYTMKLGGSNVQINVPLESGQGTVWSLSFSPSQENTKAYPNFKVGNLRGIYKNR